MEQNINLASEEIKESEKAKKIALCLLCSIGIYKYGTTWYAVEQQFIRWNSRMAKFSKTEAYTLIDELNLIDQGQGSESSLPKMLINAQGEDYLRDVQINISEIREKVCSMDDVETELRRLEEKIFNV
jgi:hypothetical protein